MERHAATFRLRPGHAAEYIRAHDEIWPEMAEAIRSAGMLNYSLFLSGDDVIEYAEAPSVAETLAAIARTDVSRRWQVAMAEHFDVGPAGSPPWVPVFQLDYRTGAEPPA